MTWELHPDLYVRAVGNAIVGLDLRSGRYRLLQGSVAGAITRLGDGEANDSDIALLRERDLLVLQVEESPVQSHPRLQPATRSLFDEPVKPASVRASLRTMADQMLERRGLGRQPLAVALETYSKRMRATVVGDPADYLDTIAAYRRSRRYHSQTDQCLVCSLAMGRTLARQGLRADLVIGVTLPFAAHCWLQSGDLVLNDRLDRVRSYEPILIR